MDEPVVDDAPPETCASTSSLFVEPLPFDRLGDGGQEGVLTCARCSAKLGRWSWVGTTCDCGAHVVPSFQFLRKKVRWAADSGVLRCLDCGQLWSDEPLKEAPHDRALVYKKPSKRVGK